MYRITFLIVVKDPAFSSFVVVIDTALGFLNGFERIQLWCFLFLVLVIETWFGRTNHIYGTTDHFKYTHDEKRTDSTDPKRSHPPNHPRIPNHTQESQTRSRYL